MLISTEKSKVLSLGVQDVNTAVQLSNRNLEEVECFTYLGSAIRKG